MSERISVTFKETQMISNNSYDNLSSPSFVVHKKTGEVRRVLSILIPKKYAGKHGIKKELQLKDTRAALLQQPLERDVMVDGGLQWVYGDYLWVDPKALTILMVQFNEMWHKQFSLDQTTEAATFAKTGKGKLLRITTQVIGDWTSDLSKACVKTVDERGILADQPERVAARDNLRKAKKIAKQQKQL
jgi:hypothetical protein